MNRRDTLSQTHGASFVVHTQQEQKRQDMYEEFLKEKLMIDEIVRKIYEEDQRYARAVAKNHHHIITLLLF